MQTGLNPAFILNSWTGLQITVLSNKKSNSQKASPTEALKSDVSKTQPSCIAYPQHFLRYLHSWCNMFTIKMKQLDLLTLLILMAGKLPSSAGVFLKLWKYVCPSPLQKRWLNKLNPLSQLPSEWSSRSVPGVKDHAAERARLLPCVCKLSSLSPRAPPVGVAEWHKGNRRAGLQPSF